MFINCRHCNALVATDPATDLPPERCPRCAGVLRRPEMPAPMPASSAQEPDVPAVVAVAAAAVADTPPTADASRPTAATPDGSPPPPAVGSPYAPATSGSADGDPAASPAVPPPADVAAPAPTPPAEPAPDVAPASVADDPPPAPSSRPASGESAQAIADATGPDVAETGTDTPAIPAAAPSGPGFLSTTPPASTKASRARHRWRAAAIVALAVALGLQVLLADRARLAADARWRPLVATACSVFGCSLPPWREPDAFVLLTREVRPHPDVPGALRVRATFRNDARWPQAWPRLVLTLSDVDGRPVAARAFGTQEYHGAATSSLVAPGQTVDIALDIREPSTATVSYAFDFVP